MSDATSSPWLELGVRLELDRFSLDVTLDCDAQVLGLLGPSGAGKTSLVETIAGLRRGARGRLSVQGQRWLDSEARLDLPAHQRAVGYVPQEALLFPHLDVRGNLLAGAKRAQEGGHDAASLLAEVSETLELEPLLGRGVADLSGGEARRVSLGRALCSGPRLLLLDEPLTGLDAAIKQRALSLLASVRARFGVPMLLVSHDAADVSALADEVVVLRAGKVERRGAARDVLRA